jgi:hypothetical protein
MSDGDHEEDERVLRKAAMLGEQSLNQMDRWRLDGARRREKRAQDLKAAEREQERVQAQARQRERDDVEALRAELRQTIADVRGEMRQQHEAWIEIVGTALGGYGNKIVKEAEDLVRSSQRDLFALVEKRFAEMAARLEAITPDAKQRESKAFKFASESAVDDKKPIDLPDWRTKMN